MTDFIIVGRGLAATVLAHTFHKHHLTFKIIGNPALSQSSLVAAGIWNPVVFKRLTTSWLAEKTVPFLKTFYSEFEKKSGKKIMFEKPIVKPFMQEQEKQLWLKKSKNELVDFLGDIVQLENYHIENCNVNGEGGLVINAGNIHLVDFIKASELLFRDHIITEIFDYALIKKDNDCVSYKDTRSKNIIFCEGHLVKNNPFFNWIPLKPAKGEILTVGCPGLELNNSILNKGNFIFQYGAATFKTGSTYKWDDLNDIPTAHGREELESKLKNLVTCEYTVVKHEAGVRPSSVDRRPIVGAHPLHSNFFVFNGLGTKGVMLAPWFANNFVFCYQQKQALNAEADVKRFYHLYKGAD
jgi:glycine oxidase